MEHTDKKLSLAAQVKALPAITTESTAGETCTTPDGRSGYVMSCGDKNVCVPDSDT